MKRVTLILSGGLDSSTLAFWIKDKYNAELTCITFDYGQKHIKELQSATIIANLVNAKHHIIDLSFIKKFLHLANSSLVNEDLSIPHGEYTKQNMQSTVVPNRNTLMLSVAWTIACINNSDSLAYGAHSGDHYLYPDTRPEYFNALNTALRLGVEDVADKDLKLIAPFINYSKAQIVFEGARLHVPFNTTWTCYQGEDTHCGQCGACYSRKKAFLEANVEDKTIYKI